MGKTSRQQKKIHLDRKIDVFWGSAWIANWCTIRKNCLTFHQMMDFSGITKGKKKVNFSELISRKFCEMYLIPSSFSMISLVSAKVFSSIAIKSMTDVTWKKSFKKYFLLNLRQTNSPVKSSWLLRLTDKDFKYWDDLTSRGFIY